MRKTELLHHNVRYTLLSAPLQKLLQGPVPDDWKFILSAMDGVLTPEKPVLTEYEIASALGVAAKKKKLLGSPWFVFLDNVDAMLEQGCLVQLVGESEE